MKSYDNIETSELLALLIKYGGLAEIPKFGKRKECERIKKEINRRIERKTINILK